MQQNLVLTVLGPDRTGIVDSLATTVKEHGGSWQESQMARLAGQFAGLVQITCSEDSAGPLTSALKELATSGLQITIAQDSSPSEKEKRSRFELDVLGNDRPGILAEVSRALRSEDANIVEMETRLESAPESGHPIFRTIALITLENGVEPDALTASLEALSPDLQVALLAENE